ncbi:hypothetical protein HDEF_0522 [Candidatus Hamiltonella defensa 5AT (Acyrthosiphon pisum)]|uniref:Uncharacterized protein n=1 Tax=Hamiltonella defensa subsp. Acyrthosiphon pisum (strain 5AT) TaxID=572265 RepID=C4K3Y3_HAMD5|nr:hypothetical protein HDEF_0522 [Candidatus Hamiltonella defensa 5AT (Acyrthosiphon pisum)]
MISAPLDTMRPPTGVELAIGHFRNIFCFFRESAET